MFGFVSDIDTFFEWNISLTWRLWFQELDWESVAAGLLHDTVEDTNVVTFERIEEDFGTTVRHIVEGETKVVPHIKILLFLSFFPFKMRLYQLSHDVVEEKKVMSNLSN